MYNVSMKVTCDRFSVNEKIQNVKHEDVIQGAMILTTY